MNAYKPNGAVLQRHPPCAQERDDTIRLLSLLGSVHYGESLQLTMASGHSARIGPNTLRAILAVLAIQARPTTATLYVLDDTDHYKNAEVRELTGFSPTQVNYRSRNGKIPKIGAEKDVLTNAPRRYPAKAIIELIAARDDIELDEGSSSERTEQ